MSHKIEAIDRSLRDKNYKRDQYYDCYLEGIKVGEISMSSSYNWRDRRYCASVYEGGNGWMEEPRLHHDNCYPTVFAAKRGMMKAAEAYLQTVRMNEARKAPVAYLPSADSDFYPTPSSIAGRMFAGVNWNKVKTVLEPSAGKGDLVLHAMKRNRRSYIRGNYYSRDALDIDCIEIDQNLRAILTGNGLRVVHDDFLTFTTMKKYDLIVMNPPFSEGDLHLIHALELCETGGQIACILNAETLRNPCTNSRKLLIKKLREANAVINYIADAFSKAERQARVDVAIINVDIPRTFADETLWENMRKAHEERYATGVKNELAPSDNVERLIREHDLMCDAGIQLMRTFSGIAPHIDFIKLEINDSSFRDDGINASVNRYLCSVRGKYWRQLFNLPELKNRMTSQMQKQYSELIDQMREYEFSRFNIQQVLEKIMAQLVTGVEDAISMCFKKLSDEHSYNENIQNDNIHYYNGWKTNRAHYVNMKVIIPTYGCFARGYKADKYGRYKDTLEGLDVHGCFGVLDDLEKALNYLDNGETVPTDLYTALKVASDQGRSSKISCKYFWVTFYKKGTCHITFKDKKIVDRLNIYIGRTRSWLPPCYGSVRYEEMDDESRRVVDEFQGEQAYRTVYNHKDEYLIDVKAPLMLTAG